MPLLKGCKMKAKKIIIEIQYEMQTVINYVILADNKNIDELADKIETLINKEK